MIKLSKELDKFGSATVYERVDHSIRIDVCYMKATDIGKVFNVLENNKDQDILKNRNITFVNYTSSSKKGEGNLTIIL